MTDRMTDAEIADWIEENYSENYGAGGETLGAQLAAKIREVSDPTCPPPRVREVCGLYVTWPRWRDAWLLYIGRQETERRARA